MSQENFDEAAKVIAQGLATLFGHFGSEELSNMVTVDGVKRAMANDEIRQAMNNNNLIKIVPPKSNLDDPFHQEVLNKILAHVPEQLHDEVRDSLKNANRHSFEVLNVYASVAFKDLDNYCKTVLASTYCAWFCYMDDEDFVEKYRTVIDEPNDNISELREENKLLDGACIALSQAMSKKVSGSSEKLDQAPKTCDDSEPKA